MDGETRGEHDRSVVRALRSLEQLTGPTATERQRIRDRILLALDDEPTTASTTEPADADDPTVAASPNGEDDTRDGTTSTARRVGRGTPPGHATGTPGHAGRPPGDASRPPGHAGGTAGPHGRPAGNGRPAGGNGRTTGDRRTAGADGRTTGDGRPAGADSRTRRLAGPRGQGGQVRPRGRDDDRRTGPAAGRDAGRRAGSAPERRGVLAGARGRLAVAALALLTLVGSLTGMSVLLARDALPGDTLYGVKRTAEAASLGLTFGEEPKALKHLEFAAARVSEIETLARRYPNPGDAPVGGYLTALTDFDNDATAGSRSLIAVAIATSTDGRLLESLRDWSALQAGRLQRVASQLPEAARNRQTASHALLDHITTRADTLLIRLDCSQITSGSSDDIGALPATGGCETRPAPASSTPPPSVTGTTDNPVPAPPGPETPAPTPPPATGTSPALPVPGATVSVPLPTGGAPAPDTPTTTPPLVQLPPLLPGLPTVSIG